MPFYDFTCSSPSCLSVKEHFLSYSALSNPIPCHLCSSPTHYTPTFGRATDSQRFSPIVIHQDAHGNISYPGSSSDPTPAGYQRIEITSLRQADNFVSRVNNEENARRRDNLYAEQSVWDQRTKERQERIDAHIRTHSINPKVRQLMDFVRTKTSERRAKQFQAQLNRGVNFHVQALSFDASNRQPYNGPDTSFRGRK